LEESFYPIAWQLGKYFQFNQNNQETEHIQTQTNLRKSCDNEQQTTLRKPMLSERTDIAWFSCLFDIRPGNGVGLFFQSRSTQAVRDSISKLLFIHLNGSVKEPNKFHVYETENHS